MACRDSSKANTAAQEIRRTDPKGEVVVRHLDLSSLASVREFSNVLLEKESRLHLLINNAGLMAINENRTADGFEMQFGVNHLGHFALTSMLMPLLLSTPQSRVVSISSNWWAISYSCTCHSSWGDSHQTWPERRRCCRSWLPSERSTDRSFCL
jgi:retinol dehydrogenase-12